MLILFEDDDLRRIYEDYSFVPKKFGPDIVKAFRKKMQLLKDSVDERDLYQLKSLRLEKLSGDRAGTSSIRLNKQFRLIIKFKTNDAGRSVVVIELVDYH